MKEIRDTVLVLIPVFNNIQDIDLTIQSVLTQDFDKDNIYITAVDFGSTDGSYEKLLEYSSFSFSLYQYKGNFTRSAMPALARKFFIGSDGWQYQLLLMPGDVIYPQYLKKVTDKMKKFRIENPEKRLEFLVSEVDIRCEDGIVEFNNPLCTEEGILQVGENIKKYLEKSYKNNMICFGGEIVSNLHRHFSLQNERIWWNEIALSKMAENIVYLPERLACIKERYYEDELREILLRWEEKILFMRKQSNEVEAARMEVESKFLERILALYALWRSFLLEKKGDKKQARECYKISSVICPEIKHLELYLWMRELLTEDRMDRIQQIEEAFLNDRGGIFTEIKENYSKS